MALEVRHTRSRRTVVERRRSKSHACALGECPNDNRITRLGLGRTVSASGEVVGAEECKMLQACVQSALVPLGDYLLDGPHVLVAEAPVERSGHGARLVRIAHAHDGARQHRRA